jgi:hypothetical protein
MDCLFLMHGSLRPKNEIYIYELIHYEEHYNKTALQK